MNTSLIGKTAIVCGGTDGIGKATALELAGLGARVILVARNSEKLAQVCAALPVQAGQTHGMIVADFSKPETLQAALAEWRKTDSSPVSILINNTGGPAAGPAIDAQLAEFRNAFEQHLICNHILATTLVPDMKQLGYGRIINVISTSVKQPLHNLGVSNTIRGAVASWAKTLANELGRFGITVNNVLPGATSTGRLTAIIDNKAAKTQAAVSDVAAEMVKEIPAGRFGEPEEIAQAIAFLASPAAAYINGINLPVDGGRTGCL